MQILFERVRESACSLPTKNEEDSGYDLYLDTQAFRGLELSDIFPSDLGDYPKVKSYVVYGDALYLYPQERVLVPSGWKSRLEPPYIQIPTVSGEVLEFNTELQVRTKSGLGHKKGLVVTLGIGTVDSLYPGEIKVSLLNIGKEVICVKDNQKFAQLVPALVLRPSKKEVSNISFDGERVGGFGSTGV